MSSLPEQIILSCFYLLSNSSYMLYIHLFLLSVPYFFPISRCHSSALPICHDSAVWYKCPVDDQHHLSDTGSSCASCSDIQVALVFVHHLLYSSFEIMNIRYCCLSPLSLFLCDLQSIPNYLVVNYSVGTLSIWAYVICVAVLRAHILEVAHCHA